MKYNNHAILASFLLLMSTAVTSSISSGGLTETGVILIGDTGRDDQGQLDVSRSLSDFCTREKCDLGMLTGDNVYHAGVASPTDTVLERMFDKYYNQLNIRFLVALGNHDYGKLTKDWKRGSYQLLHAKKNPLFHLPSYFYTHETPEAVIAVIDTTRLMWKKDARAMEQMLEAAQKSAQEKKKWYIVMGHHPFLSNGKHGNAGKYDGLSAPYFASGSFVKSFLKKNVCGKAQFYFSGHDHSLQVIDGNIAGCDTQLVVSGSGASGSKLYKKNATQFETNALGYFHVTIRPDSMRLRAVNSKAEVLFEKNYLKP